ncbi:MAG TPA: cobalamin B12-binding domain-containing protein [Acholeplasmataceae bacterium]|nr:cobalamin B12-binding domain-containing protein [Acholeplasmataceae bacterium]HRX45128.1 cobalamin B12-binding domain-containing protein [Acholeplasmataceae bacterium]
MNHALFNEFLSLLKQEDKPGAVNYALKLIKENKVTLEELYLHILAPSLIYFQCQEKDEDICIWKEHFRTSIIRTILESCYQYVLERTKDIKKNNIKIVVLTPAFEYHEIGAIMNTHFMMLEGFDAHYIGANTPKVEILSAIRAYHPDFIALSVTNPYNIVVTKQTTDEIKRFFPEVGIILGGQAFKEAQNIEHLTYDYILNSLDDLKQFAKKVTSK